MRRYKRVSSAAIGGTAARLGKTMATINLLLEPERRFGEGVKSVVVRGGNRWIFSRFHVGGRRGVLLKCEIQLFKQTQRRHNIE